ncbi:MAG TPA: 2-phospho-L-lactate transferase CofD family protein [Burkholderiales bacterium]|nr:2-phospho-L-lactate transferase CofD family protein [Burkholderiales bacterium]
MGTVVTLAGQVGAAKLADGLYRLRGADLAVICNTGDDFEHLGLAFSPDIDTMLYALAGMANPEAGWQPAGETKSLYGMLTALGGPDRPVLGDKSLAAALLRADARRDDRSLTALTLQFARNLGISARVLPMSDDQVRTWVETSDGDVAFPEYFNALACEPAVKGFRYAGAEDARVSDEVLDALHANDLEAVIIGPANPFHSIRPILEIGGMKQLLRKRGAPVVAVTPIVGAKALSGTAGKMMRELGREVSPRAAAMEYYKLIDGFVIDAVDEAQADGILASGIEVLIARTVMRTPEDRVALAQTVLDFAHAIRVHKAREAD